MSLAFQPLRQDIFLFEFVLDFSPVHSLAECYSLISANTTQNGKLSQGNATEKSNSQTWEASLKEKKIVALSLCV